MKAGAATAKARAELELLERSSLPAAYAALGEAARRSGFQTETGSLEKEVNSLEEALTAAEVPAEQAEHETLTDAAKRKVAEGKRRLDVERLKRSRKQVLTRLGEAAEAAHQDADPPSDVATAAALKKVSDLRDRQSALQREVGPPKVLDHMSTGKPSFAGRAALIAAGLVALLAGVSWFSPLAGISANQSGNSNVAGWSGDGVDPPSAVGDLQGQLSDIRETTQRYEQSLLAEEKTRREEIKLREAKKRAEAERRRLEQEQIRRVRDAKLAAAAETRASEAAKETARAERRRQAEAEAIFDGINMDPASDAALSASLREVGSSVELRGREYKQLLELHAAKNWLELTNAIRGSYHRQLPDVRVMQYAANDLLAKDFILLLKTNYDAGRADRPQLSVLSFPSWPESAESYRTRKSVASLGSNWARHPDGIGYYHDWSPGDGGILIVNRYYYDISDFIQSVEDTINERRREIYAKRELGEYDDATVIRLMLDLRAGGINRIKNWALDL